MYDLAVVGAGASGLVCAISAKRKNPGLKVILTEALHEPGKKILATGNGRCNLSNSGVKPDDYNHPEFAAPALENAFKETEAFFRSVGVMITVDTEGRAYPMSNTALSVQRALRGEVKRLGIELLSDTRIASVERKNDCFVLNGKIRTRALVLSCSGTSSPSQGSDGSGYVLLKQLGHSVTPCFPGLVRMRTEGKIKSLAGVRVRAVLTLEIQSETYLSSGELQFTENGLSGIAVMDLSNFLRGRTGVMHADVLPALSAEDIAEFLLYIRENSPETTLSEAFNGLLPRKLGEYIIRGLGTAPESRTGDTESDVIYAAAGRAKRLTFRISGTDDFRQAQITIGGADVAEFDAGTLQSLLVPGLFCTGELLDVSARCGGFNLQWAWSSGMLAGKSAAGLPGSGK